MMPAADMIPAAYGEGRYLRRWSLIGGHPRCVLPPLAMAEASPTEIAATEAENARLHGLASAAEAYEAAVALTAGREAPPALPDTEGGTQPSPSLDAWNAALATIAAADEATLALVALRAGEASGDPVTVALVDPDGMVVNVVAVDAGWQPAAPLVAVPAGPGARAGGAYADGVFTAPAPVATLDDYRAAIAALVEATAHARDYSSAASCAGYAASTVPAWAAEAAAFVAWRDAVYLAAYARLAEVQAGAPPPTVADLIASLPAIDWPA
ncbi:hypothetical protein [Falsiroseomonas sp.]|uniref:hypothetical protein n=1 Tax=Falsiroseomonas sp. TaxID=2870721 RepID=UPI0027352FF0|nr:hypothetical protein [Falsiroseomonas sp.]MDP3414632.1 hypothetical protein [Falsiroseomonas sp.]